MVWISGYASKPRDLSELTKEINQRFPNVHLQLVDLDKVPGSRYLFLATLNAMKSFSSKPISKSLEMEILLFVAANRQITEAIRLVGIASDTSKTTAVLVGMTEEDLRGAADLLSRVMGLECSDELTDRWGDQRIRNVRSLFQISPKELKSTLRKGEPMVQAVERLAIERSALLTINK
jgi:tRNA threonylcarbamoyladenosine modification (KEOPS) complex Cgi121 subunit